MTDYVIRIIVSVFFLITTPTSEIYTLSLHDALPISPNAKPFTAATMGFEEFSILSNTLWPRAESSVACDRSEEHTSELQSRRELVCRLLLEKKKMIRRLESILS